MKTVPLTLQQQAIKNRCFHPTGHFYPFERPELEFSLVHRFEEMVLTFPEQLALQADGMSFTYAELNNAANQVAAWLHAQRNKAEEGVALLLDQGPEMIIAALGVLKCGKMCIPLDPTLPAMRMDKLLAHSFATLAVTTSDYASLSARLASQEICVLDIDTLDLSEPTPNRRFRIPPDALAYLLYTSGSTGEPKGVVHSHRSLLHSTMNCANGFRICAKDRMSLLAPCRFIGPVRDLFAALLNGASLHPFDIRDRPGSDLARWLADEEITICYSVTTVFRHLVDSLNIDSLNGAEQFPYLRLIRLGGEPVYTREVENFKCHFSDDAILVNALGSTETLTFCWYFVDGKSASNQMDGTQQPSLNGHRKGPVPKTPESQAIPNVDLQGIESQSNPTNHVVPAGYALQDYTICLLDDEGNELVGDQAGEIAIKGRYFAPRYWRQGELTDTSMVPTAAGDGQRLYRTGDLGRFQADGALVHLGRKDFQAKIRGHRVEVAEIELALLALETIQEVAVVARPAPNGDVRLLAYFVPTTWPAPTVSELHQHLNARLAAHMIPASFVPLHLLPRTPTDKIDRRALPEPEQIRPQLSNLYQAPKSQVENALAEICATLLGFDEVGVDDNFFELGGHSLLATQLISRIQERFAITVPLRDFFAQPTIEWCARQIEAVSRNGQSPSVAAEPIRVIQRSDELALSYGQQRLWFLEQLALEPNPKAAPQLYVGDAGEEAAHAAAANSAYHISALYRLQGTVDIPVLERSVNEIIARHEILRSVYVTRDGLPSMTIMPQMELGMTVVDCRSADNGMTGEQEPLAQKEFARNAAEKAAREPFELAAGPLLRTHLIQYGDGEFFLLITMHHIISDGWSLGLFKEELAALYQAHITGQPSRLTELPIQYPDFTAWQRDKLNDARLEPQLNYWIEKLENAPTALNLPTDFTRAAIQRHRGARHSFALSAELTAALKQLGQVEGHTLYMTLLTAFNILLYRYSGQTDILVGTPIASRNRVELEALIGFFVNTLVMRTNLAENPTARALLAQVHETAVDAYAHQQAPFEKLVELLHPERNLSHAPLVQVMFAFQNMPRPVLELPDLKIWFEEIELGTAALDCTLFMWETGDELRGSIEYSTDLFQADTIERMAGHFICLLESMVANPEQSIAQLSMLPASEQKQLLVDWNQTAADSPPQSTIHQLFEVQARRTPDEPAILFDADSGPVVTIGYGALNERANQLAHHLREQGVQPGSFVGLSVERSIDMVVALLAILKAGGAYLPLDPAYPLERLSFMLEDSGVPLLLTDEPVVSQFENYTGKTLGLAQALKDASGYPTHDPQTALGSEDLAYLIYTSGSTGRPKGVQIQHRAVVNFLTTMAQRPGMDSADTLLAITTLSFDIAVLELFLPLVSGGRLALTPSWLPQDGAALQAVMQRSGATIMQAAPATWRLLIHAGWQGDPHLKILCGGEALTGQLARELQSRSRELWNMYGPTETTIWSAIAQVDATNLPEDVILPIGSPIANTQLYIVDQQMQPVPVGIPGELLIGGAGLAKGYLNHSALTSERFIPNPFGQGRLYRTGDLAHYLADGTVAFLGRSDNQVKIRGFRIELGEIELALAAHPHVKEAVVLAAEDQSQSKQLVAYFVPTAKTGSSNLTTELRALLGRKLPAYMIPSRFLSLDALPLTPNGKVDRNQLPKPDDAKPLTSRPCVPPSTPTQKEIANIWTEILAAEQSGIHENFFDLGGHSLLVTQVLARIEGRYQLALSVRRFFEVPTIAELAQVIDAERDNVRPESLQSKRPSIMAKSRDAYRVKQTDIDRRGTV